MLLYSEDAEKGQRQRKEGMSNTKLRLRSTETTTTRDEHVALHGILTEWHDEQGYGFITPDDGGERVFLHIKSLKPEARRPVAGELFFYKLAADERGRPRAEEAFQTMLDERRSIAFHHSVIKGLSYFWPLALIPIFVMTVQTGNLVIGLCAAFVTNSLLTILFYWEDKHLAQYKYWRIPEKCLHVWEFLCGWPGALYAQQAFRHKRCKASFMALFWLCAIANVIALSLLFHYADAKAMGKAMETWWQDFH